MSQYIRPLLASVAFCALCIEGNEAAVIEKGGNVRVSRLENIADDLYILGSETITIDGSVEGDLTALVGSELIMRGEVGQTVNAFVGKVTSSGTVQGSFRAFTETANIDGYVGGSALVFAKNVFIESESVIERSVNLKAQSIIINGSVKGDADIEARDVTITGLIVGDLSIEADKIIIAPPAIIRGNLDYISETQAEIDTSSGVIVVGNVSWNKPEELGGEDIETDYFRSFALSFSTMLAAFLFGIIMLKLFRQYIEASLAEVRDRFSVSIATGSVALVGLVICLLVLLLSAGLALAGLTLLGENYSPIGLLLLTVSVLMVPITSFGMVGGGVIFYSGKIVLGFLIGYVLLNKVGFRSEAIRHRHLLVGLVILSLLFEIPYYIGFFVYLLAAVSGAGAIILGVKNRYGQPRQLEDAVAAKNPESTSNSAGS